MSNIFGLGQIEAMQLLGLYSQQEKDPDEFMIDVNQILTGIFEGAGIMKQEDAQKLYSLVLLEESMESFGHDDPQFEKLFSPILDVEEVESISEEILKKMRSGELSFGGVFPSEVRDYIKLRAQIQGSGYEKSVLSVIKQVGEKLNFFANEIYEMTLGEINLGQGVKFEKLLDSISAYITDMVPKMLEEKLGKEASEQYEKNLRENSERIREYGSSLISYRESGETNSKL